ncbi:MAG: response regulator [bacterium]
MAIITVLSGSYCSGDEILDQVCLQLGYRRLEKELFELTSKRHNISSEKIVSVLSGGRDKRSKEGALALACLEETAAEWIQDDNAILSGCVGFVIPNNIAHVLRVCVIADASYRISGAQKTDNLSQAAAEDIVQTYDRQLTTCVSEWVSKSAYDESLYDIVVPVDKMTTEAAVQLICKYAESDAIATTSWSLAQAKDFLLSARVKLALTRAGHLVDVFSENGRVTIGINEHALMMGRLEKNLMRLAAEVEGVVHVTTKLGPRYSAPSINPWESIDGPPKILLVDDEREFVQTLSERLNTRNLRSSIAYDGEQALEMIEQEIPDVIVLDLLMPGIDGIETLRRVKRSHPEVEVIILTGHGSDREQAMAEDLGAFAYLRKPVNVNELTRIMKEAYAKGRGSS